MTFAFLLGLCVGVPLGVVLTFFFAYLWDVHSEEPPPRTRDALIVALCVVLGLYIVGPELLDLLGEWLK